MGDLALRAIGNHTRLRTQSIGELPIYLFTRAAGLAGFRTLLLRRGSLHLHTDGAKHQSKTSL